MDLTRLFKDRKWLLIFLLVPYTFLLAQYQNLGFSHITTENGLSRSNVICITQDAKGFLWFGTSSGLNRFNGYTFDIFQYDPDNPNSISHNYISAVYIDHLHNLWVGTGDGLNRYNSELNNFKNYKNDQDYPGCINDNQIEVIFEDSKNRLWIGTRNGGLNLFHPQSETFTHYSYSGDDTKGISSNFIRVIFEDSYGRLWVGHRNGSIDIFNSDSGEFKQFLINGKKVTESRITGIVESSDKNIWIGTQGDGLYQIKNSANGIQILQHFVHRPANQNGISSNIILSLMLDSNGKLWIGTEDDGLNILDINRQVFYHHRPDAFDNSSLNHNSVYCIYEDNANNIWLGTYAGGINFLTKRKNYFRHYKYFPGKDNCLNHNIVNSFWEDKDQKLWIATDGGGLNLFDLKTEKFSYINSKNSTIKTDIILSLYEDNHNRFWVGTWADGLYLFDRTNKSFKQYNQQQNDLGSNNILQIAEDINGGLWLCTFWGGLTYFNPVSRKSVVYNTQNSGISDNNLRVLIIDKHNNLWIGSDVGLDHFDTKRKIFKSYLHSDADKKSLSKGFVLSLLETSDSTIWIGTSGGLNKFNRETNSFYHYTTKDGLPDNEIKCILEDDNQNLWLSTNKGISQFNPSQESFKNFEVSDGLQGNEFNSLSGFKMSNGDIIFGGNNGYSIIQPQNLYENLNPPPVVITDFKIFNKTVPIGSEDSPLYKHISETKQLTLSYRHSVFSFEFVALNYVSPEKNQYAYMMEGFENNWNYTGTNRTASYTNLDPGEYTFRVKASNNDGIWNEQGASILIQIEPPFWKTWWAYLAEIFIIAAIIYFILNYYIGRQRLRNALKLEHLELEKLYEMDQTKTQLFTNISHEFQSPMTLILGPLEKLIASTSNNSKIQNSLNLVHRNAQRLQRMINQLKDFYKLESQDLPLRLSRGDIIYFIKEIVNSFQEYARDHHITCRFDSELEKMIAWFDPDKLDKIIYNLLSNAFKFTPDHGEIKIKISIVTADLIKSFGSSNDKASKYIKIIIKDTGIGIAEDKIKHIFDRFYQASQQDSFKYDGTGVGLAIVYELTKAYHGEIVVNSKEGEGADFTVYIPIDEHYLEESMLVNEFSIEPYEYASSPKAQTQDLNMGENFSADSKRVKIKDLPILLIVDDDNEIRNYIKESFISKYRVIEADNGEDALKRAIKIIPDLIISDIKMPKMNGIQLCNKLKTDEKTSHIPVILLTVHSAHEYKIEGITKGADAYLAKPFNIDILEAHAENLLHSRKKLRDKFSRELLIGPKKIVVSDTDELFLNRVIEKIEKYISDPNFNADILSKKVNMSKMQLYRKIRGLTDQTVHEFIRNIRLKRAIQLLEDKRMTITEVAYEVGFNDLTYFGRCFRKQFKKSPSEFISKNT